MLRKTDISPQRCRAAAVGRESDSDDLLRTLIARLQRLGFEVPPLYGMHSNMAGGVPMQIAVRQWLRNEGGSGLVSNTIRTLLREDTPFTLSQSDLGDGDAAIDALQRLCEFLRMEIENDDRNGELVGMCIHAHQLPLQAFQVLSNSVPGAGPRYVLLDSVQVTPHDDQRLTSDTDKIWTFLWRNRMPPQTLMPAYGTAVRTACPLLTDEVTVSVLPVHGIQVPADSAWLPIRLALPQFADDSGEISWDRLSRALADGVELADKILDRLHWAEAGQRSDARMNRRLAMSITGLGDLVLRRGLDPQGLEALTWLSAIVVRIRKSLWCRSADLARRDGCLPVLCASDPSHRWADTDHRENWRHRWQVALEKSAVRHRNMLVMSPYSVLPSVASCDAAFTDLLPVIAYADAWSFADVPRTRNWNLSEYKSFHRRAWAVIHWRNTGTLVAAGV